MSVLSFPRIYFKGYMAWDPNTCNNNDYVPSYNVDDAALNWPFLEKQDPPITPATFRDEFRQWAIQMHEEDGNGNPVFGAPILPAEWNFYGGNACWFNQEKGYTSQIIGGDLGSSGVVAANDPLLGKPIGIVGNTFGGQPSGARLIDTNPASPWSSQIYFAGFNFGGEGASVKGVNPVRMHSRLYNMGRNLSDVYIAGSMGTIFQTTIATEDLIWDNSADSGLLAELQAALREKGAKGIMVRFVAHTTRYLQNGIFNDKAQQPRTMQEVSDFYNKMPDEVEPFTNPAYSDVNGTIGIWKEGELSTMPSGRFLFPVGQAKPLTSMNFAVLGPVLGEVFPEQARLSLDVSNTFPELNQDGAKACFGDVEVGYIDGDQFVAVTQFNFCDYDEKAYNRTSGIIDICLSDAFKADPSLKEKLLDRDLAFRSNKLVTERETGLVAQTDQRGIYLDEGETKSFEVQVRLKGELPPAGTRLMVAQYQSGDPAWALIAQSSSDSNISFPENDLAVDANGLVEVKVSAVSPGTPIIGLFPYLAGQTPTPPAGIPMSWSPGQPPMTTVSNAFYSTVRVLPFDDGLPAEFADCWNGTGPYAGKPKYDRQQAWHFVYYKILYLYDMLYPVMDGVVPLGNLGRVEGAIDQILALINTDMLESTLYMPVTRELSAGKRQVLQTWGTLVQQKYPPGDI